MSTESLLYRQRGYLTVVTLVLAAFLVGSCSFPQLGFQEPTPVPFAATPYAPVAEEALPTPQAARDDSQTVDAQSVAQVPAVSAAAPGGPLVYKGEILARDRLVVVSETSGMVQFLPLEVGDRIQAGDLLAQVDSAILEAQRAQALAAVEAARAQLDLLLEGASEEDLEAARAAVAAASAGYRRALDGATEEDERIALAQLRQAEAAVSVAQSAYNRVKGSPIIGMLPESLQLQQATQVLASAQAQYDKVLKGATDDVISGAYAQLAQARAQLQRLEEGAKPAQVQAAEAQVKQAETALYLAQVQLAKATIESPVDGVVAQVNTTLGAMLAPGSPIVQILSPEVDVVIPVEEYLLGQIQLGTPAQIRVEAYPDRVYEGEIALVAPELSAATRTAQVTIRPIGDATGLAPGMFATVTLQP